MEERIVIPSSIKQCHEIAIEESERNWKNYFAHGRKEEDIKHHIEIGKYGELVFCYQNSDDIEIGISIGKEKHDGGVIDLKVKKIGPVQIKISEDKYVNDLLGYKKNNYPSIDNVLLVQGFYDKKSSSIDFYCQAPSKLNWRQSKCTKGWYLDRKDMVKWTNAKDMFKIFGTFPKKKIWPDDDIPNE